MALLTHAFDATMYLSPNPLPMPDPGILLAFL